MTGAATSPFQAKRPAFRPSRLARALIAATAATAAAARLTVAVADAQRGDPSALTGFGFTVLFPLLLIGLALALGPGRTREGVLMRLGTAAQFILVIAVPPFALHLLLGLPVIFLLVELFETRFPRAPRDRIAAWFVTC